MNNVFYVGLGFTIFPVFFYVLCWSRKASLAVYFTFLQIHLVFSLCIGIPLMISQWEGLFFLKKGLFYFDTLLLPIILFILYTYQSRLIDDAKMWTLDKKERQKLDHLQYKDPRLYYVILWLTFIYIHFFEK